MRTLGLGKKELGGHIALSLIDGLPKRDNQSSSLESDERQCVMQLFEFIHTTAICQSQVLEVESAKGGGGRSAENLGP